MNKSKSVQKINKTIAIFVTGFAWARNVIIFQRQGQHFHTSTYELLRVPKTLISQRVTNTIFSTTVV